MAFGQASVLINVGRLKASFSEMGKGISGQAWATLTGIQL